MPPDNLQAYKVIANELSSSTKFNNLVQATEDGLNTIENTQIVAGSSEQFLKTVAGVTTWVGSYSSYVPTWTSDGSAPSLGNGIIAGNFLRIGNHVVGRLGLVFGSTTTFGTGNYFFSLPVAISGLPAASPVGSAVGFDASGGPQRFAFVPAINNTTTAYLVVAAGGLVGPTVPVTWVNTDEIRINWSYEVA